MSAQVTIIGNVTADPVLRTTPGGKSVLDFTVAYTPLQPDGSQGNPNFYDVTAWQWLADNLAASLKKGDRVIVLGRLRQQKWENEEGNKRSKIVVVADEVGASMRFATVDITKVKRSDTAAVAEVVEAEADEDVFAS